MESAFSRFEYLEKCVFYGGSHFDNAAKEWKQMRDVTRTLISNSEMREQIGAIFPDALILTTRFDIVSVSQNVLAALGYTRAELAGKPLEFLSRTFGLQTDIEP